MSSAAVLRDLARAFDELGVRWYVFGAQAAILFGSTRVTEDVDVTVDLGERPTRDLVLALEASGFALRVKDAAAFVARARVLPFVHQATRMPADVVLSGPGLEELFFSRLTRHSRDGQLIPAACAEDIIVMKILAGRSHDREDILAVMRARGSRLDERLVRETLGLLEEALDQNDLVPELDALLGEARRSKATSATPRLAKRRKKP